jgi:hypothetical protein
MRHEHPIFVSQGLYEIVKVRNGVRSVDENDRLTLTLVINIHAWSSSGSAACLRID